MILFPVFLVTVYSTTRGFIVLSRYPTFDPCSFLFLFLDSRFETDDASSRLEELDLSRNSQSTHAQRERAETYVAKINLIV